MAQKLKSTLALFVFFLMFSFGIANAKQLPIVVFINHVRGTECCDQGSLNSFQKQLEIFSEQNLPAFFALRYDALTDPKFIKIIKQYQKNNLFKYGLMLEVTPKLAKDSFVSYEGTPENWFQAQYAFLIGYSQEDRTAILDKLISSYQEVFSTNPEFTTAWQVDTYSLNYLQKKYGLKMHQLAREQWGLDSYTLDGGPPHYPYLASENWAFVPDFSDPSHLLIVRHTVDDPLYSYGDKTSAFTSQPNDYDIDQKDFGYFERLLNQALEQFQQPGYVNLGLENSMAEKYQLEYHKQIAKIKEFASQEKVEVISDIARIKGIFASQPITIHSGKDLINNTKSQVFWVTTPKYRLRIRFNDLQTQITDLRVYHPQLLDPYFENQALNKGYLISPYLINAGIAFPPIKEPSWGQKLLKIPSINTFLAEPSQDLTRADNSLILPPITDWSSIQQPSLNTISYLSQGKTITISFNQDNFEISPLIAKDIGWSGNNTTKFPITIEQKQNGGQLNWQIEDKKSLSTNWQCDNKLCQFSFDLNPQLFEEMITKQYPFIFPEKKTRPLSQKNTLVYAHNRYAIAGRNPVRLIIVPQDENGFPTSTASEAIVTTSPEAKLIKIEAQNSSREYQIIDIENQTPTAMELSLSLDHLALEKQIIYFAPNCKNELIYCLTHPKQAWWFIRTTIEDKMRLKLLGENQD